MRPHCASTVLMVAPEDFGFNLETARDNEFQHQAPAGMDYHAAVMDEFSAACHALTQAGIEVVLLPKNPSLPTLPDAVFPNNWFSTWPDGSVYLYPMRTLNRQAEVRPEDLRSCLHQHHYVVSHLQSLDGAPGLALEGTGALVFDHVHQIMYASRSERCDSLLAQTHARQIGYQAVLFDTCSSHGRPFYHTNVMMSMGEQFALICMDAVVAQDRTMLRQNLQASKRDVIEISLAQAEQFFCANVLQLQSSSGQKCIAMSASAYNAFTDAQRQVLSTHGKLIPLAIPTIEHMGGGSVRCMLAEIFLDKRA